MKELIKRLFPYMHKCRVYRVFLESDGSSTVITRSDLKGLETTMTVLKLPDNFNVVDYICDFHMVEPNNSQSIQYRYTITAEGKRTIATLHSSAFDYGYVYIYGYFEK